MLEKDWNGQNPSYQDTLSKMSFIAARKLVKMPFESYIELLKKELQEVSYGDEAKEHILNESSRDKMELADIEKGIELGMELIKQKENM